MKNIFCLLVFALIGALQPQTADAQSWPFGKADYQTVTVAADSTISIDVTNRLTYVTVTDCDCSYNTVTINLDIPSKIQKGSFLFIEITAGEDEQAYEFGDKLSGVDLGIDDDGDVWILQFLYDGTNFKNVGKTIFIDQ